MTLDDVAKFLQVHPSTVYRLIKGHRIPAFKVGSDWRFNQKSIEQWIREGEASNDVVEENATAVHKPLGRPRRLDR